MSIEIKSSEILGLCKKLNELRKNQIRASDYTSIKNDLEDILSRIEPISKTVIALANQLKNNVANNPIPNAPKETASLLDAALTIVKGNEQELAAMNLPKFRSIFNTLREQLKTRADTDWLTLKNQHVPWPEDLLSGLAAIKFHQEVKTIRECEENVDTTNFLPKDKGDIENFLRSVKQYQLATKEINLPESIKNFLQDATRGVPLDSFDSEVQSWLQEHNLINKFAIKFVR